MLDYVSTSRPKASRFVAEAAFLFRDRYKQPARTLQRYCPFGFGAALNRRPAVYLFPRDHGMAVYLSGRAKTELPLDPPYLGGSLLEATCQLDQFFVCQNRHRSTCVLAKVAQRTLHEEQASSRANAIGTTEQSPREQRDIRRQQSELKGSRKGTNKPRSD
jgi:hypothetical protein